MNDCSKDTRGGFLFDISPRRLNTAKGFRVQRINEKESHLNDPHFVEFKAEEKNIRIRRSWKIGDELEVCIYWDADKSRCVLSLAEKKKSPA